MAELEDEEDLLASLLHVAEAELNSLNGIKIVTSKNSEASSVFETSRENFLSDIDKFTASYDSKKMTIEKRTEYKGVETTLTSFYDGVDSSDDEGNRNYEKQKYSEYGRNIKDLLFHSHESSLHSSKSPAQNSQSKSWKAKNIKDKALTSAGTKKNNVENKSMANVYTDPIFGISIINPLISSKILQERMVNRKAIPICQISKHLKTLKKDDDWVIAGVICSKGITKTSANGNQYLIWTMSDLLGKIQTIALFLFGTAYKQFWKTQPGCVVGILNPSILDKREGSTDEAVLSIDNAQKILILGQSKDLGTCKSTKKNGEKCTAIVNKSKCEVCVYHIRQEYQKCSRRSELQANFSGKGLIALRNKVLGKNEVFYAGKSYTAITAKQSKKLLKKDQNRLQSLSDVVTISPATNPKKKNNIHKAAASFDVVRSQRIRDIETLKKLGVNIEKYGSLSAGQDFENNYSSSVTLNESKANALKVLSKLSEKNKQTSPTLNKTNSFSGTYDDPNRLNKTQLQKSLDEIVNKDLIDLNVSHDMAQKHLVTSGDKYVEVKENSHYFISSSKSDSPYDKNKVDLKIPTSLTNVEKPTGKINGTSIVPFAAKKTENGVKSAFKEEARSAELPPLNEQLEAKGIKKNKYADLVFSKSLIMSASPTLTKNDNYIDLNEPIISKQAQKAKLKAVQIIHKNGPLRKSDPNNMKGRGVKRCLEDVEVPINGEIGRKLKKIKENEFLSDRFKKMMELQSKHLDLLEIRDDEEKQKYFKKLEVKEQLEEKMANTYKIECKAVRCLTCKYTSFSAADKCKTEKHRFKVFNAFKRFFKCGHCSNRIACLDIVPLGSCKNCGSSNWERTTMMKEKRILNTVSLSIRGGEQQYINSTITDANINLLVPDED